ncbi:MAG: winged helix DNA-binding protein [Alphaproteobacteria bacterium]|nr:winged helix DNA-binding protein [Alphaproteobacteria bacterium]
MDTLMNDTEATDNYVQMTRMIERLHRRHLDMLRYELDRLGVEGVSAAQVLMLTKIQDRAITVRDLVERGYYLGSNASYNIKQLADFGLIEQERSPHDKRSVRVRLTKKGKELCDNVAEAEATHAKAMVDDADGAAEIETALRALRRLETTWSEYLRYDSF